MTADPFTEAAAAKAEQWWPEQSYSVFVNPSLIREEMVRMAVWARTHLTATLIANDSQSGSQSAAQEPTDAELDALYDAFMAHNEDERSEEYTRTEDGEPYHERICSECGEAVWIKGEHYWAATRANGARKRHHVARAALSAAARAARRDEEKR